MDISNDTKIPKITYITPFIQERKKKHCICEDRHFIIDEMNREVTCSKCGCVIESFEALLEIAKGCNKVDTYLENRYKYAVELEKWFKNNRVPTEIKHLVENYRWNSSMNALPECPHCHKNFNFTDIKCYSNPKFRVTKEGNEND